MDKLNQIERVNSQLASDWIIKWAEKKLSPLEAKEAAGNTQYQAENPEAGFFDSIDFDPLSKEERETYRRLLNIIIRRTEQIEKKKQAIINNLSWQEAEQLVIS
ncbi:hypothetical protein PL75_03100 [Neisseria arctica]|uniref:Uncharacterized protein n=1 Tax=Neisseria arctica TaxID=1470200 RepID=A0A0J0YSV6_9NEIS|nr:hypothetical protein [Neisseria arctica]KLT73235.1 hypothetical protein PL75_03100 [Neisseria arctica]UOO87519.1 hypothetical protein LVJ86_04540 [Neisseria arctica]